MKKFNPKWTLMEHFLKKSKYDVINLLDYESRKEFKEDIFHDRKVQDGFYLYVGLDRDLLPRRGYEEPII